MRIISSLVLIIITISCSKKGIDTEIYLPKGYNKNYIIIFYDIPTGEKMESSNEKTIYRIPSSGILFSQNSQQLNSTYKEDIFLTDSLGKKKLLLDYHKVKYMENQNINQNEIYKFNSFFTDKENFGYSCSFHFIGKEEEIYEQEGIIKPMNRVKYIIDSIITKKYP